MLPMELVLWVRFVMVHTFHSHVKCVRMSEWRTGGEYRVLANKSNVIFCRLLGILPIDSHNPF